MRVLARSLVAAGVALLSWSCHAQKAAPQPTAAPVLAAQAICRPAFMVGSDKVEAGTAFILDGPGPGGRSLLVSAMHLFGPAGGLEADIPWTELSGKVASMTCEGIVTKQVWRGGRALTITGARPFDPQGKAVFVDISAFPMDPASAAGGTHLKLAGTAPREGDRVWLVAQLAQAAPTGQLLHAATVVASEDQALLYAYDQAGLALDATSGAPVVNAAGDLVAINLGGGEQDNRTLGVGDSLSSIRSALASA